jgi:hypothetical protein
MSTLHDVGLVSGYRDIVMNQRQDYPPVSLTMLWIAAFLAGGSSSLALKVLLTASWAVSLAILARLTPPFRLWFVYALLSLYAGVGLGYLDVLIMPFAFAAALVLCAEWPERLAWSATGVLVALACAVKWQPLMWLPFVAVALWKETRVEGAQARGWQRAAAFCAGFGGTVVLIVAIFGAGVLVQSFRLVFAHVAISANALNLGWIVQDLAHRVSPGIYGPLADGIRPIIWTSEPQLYWPLRIVQSAALLFCIGWALFSRYDRQTIGRAAALGYLAYFFLGPGVHENHLIPAVIVLLLVSLRDPRSARVFLVMAIFQAVNLAVFYGVDGNGFFAGPTDSLGGVAPRGRMFGVDAALALAWVGVGLFAWSWIRLFARRVGGAIAADAASISIPFERPAAPRLQG